MAMLITLLVRLSSLEYNLKTIKLVVYLNSLFIHSLDDMVRG